MNIAIPTVGSRGDVQPHIALAQGLKHAGHKVTVSSHPEMRNLVEKHGIDFIPVGPDINIVQEVAKININSRNVLTGLMRATAFIFDKLEQSHEDILAACRHADLVITSASTAAGMNEAELLDIPYISINFMPWIIPIHDSNRPISQKLLSAGMNWFIGLLMRRPFNRMRRRHNLKPIGIEGFTSALLDIIAISPHVFVPNQCWKPQHKTSGYWFADSPEIWQPPQDLLTFLESGDAPLVISIGSISLPGHNDLKTARLFVEAIRESGIRAIIQSWSSELKQFDLPPTIFSAGSVPHEWLLAHAGGIVHHGGFGTTAAGFRAGIPTLIIPHIADQFFWASHVKRLGVGLQPIPKTKLTVENLSSSLKILVSDDRLRDKAFQLGEQIRNEDGVMNAVGLIEEAIN